MDEINWYQYLDDDFKLSKSLIKTRDKVVTRCPKCSITEIVQVNNLKQKIKRRGNYMCFGCCAKEGQKKGFEKYKTTMIERYGYDNPQKVQKFKDKTNETNLARYGEKGSLGVAREAFSKKHGVSNPYKAKFVKDKIKQTNLIRHGVECVLQKPEIHQKGLEYAATPEVRLRAKETQFKNHSNFNLNRPEIRYKIGITLKKKAKALRKKWIKDGGKTCGMCKQFKSLNQYTSLKFECSKCKICSNLYENEYSKLRKAIRSGEAPKESLLGCSIQDFTDYIESQFELGMSWNNWTLNGWHLDHIIPLAKINNQNKHIINYYENFRPLWAKENISKGNKLPNVIILTGCFGVGKTTISKKLLNQYLIFDKDKKHNIYDIGKSQLNKTVIYQTSMKVVADIKLFSQFFNLKVIVIQEDLESIKQKIKLRSDKDPKDETLIKRIKRMESIAKNYGTFSGTADECLNYLIKLS